MGRTSQTTGTFSKPNSTIGTTFGSGQMGEDLVATDLAAVLLALVDLRGFGGGFSSSSFGMGGRSRRGMYGTGGRTHFNPVFKRGLNFSTGYIINTGQKPVEVPNPNEVPSRLQAFNLNTSFGQQFNLAWLVNPIPLFL